MRGYLRLGGWWLGLLLLLLLAEKRCMLMMLLLLLLLLLQLLGRLLGRLQCMAGSRLLARNQPDWPCAEVQATICLAHHG